MNLPNEVLLLIAIGILNAILSYFSFFPLKNPKYAKFRRLATSVLLITTLILISIQGISSHLEKKEQEAKLATFQETVLANQERLLSKLEEIGLGYDTIRNEIYVANKEIAQRFILQTQEIKSVLDTVLAPANHQTDSIEIISPVKAENFTDIVANECETTYGSKRYSGGRLRIINRTGLPIELLNANPSVGVYHSFYAVNMFIGKDAEGRTPLLHIAERTESTEYTYKTMDYKLTFRDIPESGKREKRGEINIVVDACKEKVLVLTKDNILFR